MNSIQRGFSPASAKPESQQGLDFPEETKAQEVAPRPEASKLSPFKRLMLAASKTKADDDDGYDEPGDGPGGSTPELMAAPEEPAMDEVRGRIVREIFKTADNYAVYLVREKSGAEHKVSVTSTVVAHKQDDIVAKGKWDTYKGKPTFKAMTIMHVIAPGSRGVARWLKNKTVAGIGQAKITSLCEFHGDNLPNIMDKPEELAKAPKITMKDANAISESWVNNIGQPDLVEYIGKFQQLGENLIHRIIKRYGAAARRIIEETPWKLADTIDGIGFDRADSIAMQAGHKPDSPARLEAGLRYTLGKKTIQNGHCAMPRDLLERETSRLLKVPSDLVTEALTELMTTDSVVVDEKRKLIYPPFLYRAERELAERLIEMVREGLRVDEAEARRAVEQAVVELGVSRDDSQVAAAIMAVMHPVCVITGGPGTGKSTTQRMIVKALEILEITYGLAAPTGRASKRLAETSGRPASTCHRLLAYSAEKGGWEFDRSNPFEFVHAIVDEFSMVDVQIANAFADAIRRNGRLTAVGDVDQLESVGAGQVLRDMIESGEIPVARLKTVHRQSGDSGIVIAANRVNTGVFPLMDAEKLNGFYVSTRFEHDDSDTVQERVVDLMARRLPKAGFDPLADIQVLAPYRDGSLGILELNKKLKAALNPRKDDNSAEIKGRVFSTGDRVIHLRNDYTKKVFNGELGTVAWVGTRVNDDKVEEPCMRVDYSGFPAFYGPKDIEDVELSWAATVHKSQGCEFPVVVLVVPFGPRILLTRNLLYTAITRAKKECIVIGCRESIEHAVNAVQVNRRFTGLASRLSTVELDEAA